MRKLPLFVLALLAVFMAIPMTALAADAAPAAADMTPRFTNAALKWIAFISPAIVGFVHLVRSPGGDHLLSSYGPKGKRIVVSVLSLLGVIVVGFGSSTLTMQEIIAMAMLVPFTTIGTYEAVPNGLMRKAPASCANCGHVAGTPTPTPAPSEPPVAS